MEDPQNPECSVMTSMNLPNKARETTLLSSNEQFGGDTEGAGGDTEGAGGDTEGAGDDTEGAGGGGEEQAGIINAYIFIYITTCIPVVL